jgi:hypothetical protein
MSIPDVWSLHDYANFKIRDSNSISICHIHCICTHSFLSYLNYFKLSSYLTPVAAISRKKSFSSSYALSSRPRVFGKGPNKFRICLPYSIKDFPIANNITVLTC